MSRGTTVEMTVEGLNLARASAIYFSDSGITGRILRVKELPDGSDVRLGSAGTPSSIDLGPLPPRNQVTVEVEIAPEAEIGPVTFRLLTPLGTSPEGRFLVEPYYGEAADREPNDTAETAVETFLPAILSGAISRPGDVDYYKIQVKAGQEISFLNGAMQIGSSLQPVVAIEDAAGKLLREFGQRGGVEQLMFAYRFGEAGTYYVRVTDYQHGGRAGAFYRIIAGEFPLVLGATPLGVRKGAAAEVSLRGYHVASKIPVRGEVTGGSEDTATLRPEHAFNTVRVAVGEEPELTSQGGAIPVPVTVNGRISARGAENRYRFNARKGEQLVLEVNARRTGSDLDSYLEVLDAQGNPVERAVVRPVWQTNVTLRDHDSTGRGIRIAAWSGMQAGDYVMLGSEILKIEALPLSPDADTTFEGTGGQRLTYFDTSAEAHAIDSAVYKVQILPPGSSPSPNGLPVARLYYRNDDGGPGFGRDSMVHFTAPADGEYQVRIRDVQGLGGDTYGYRLTVRRPRPDFRLTVTPRNPNVPVGGSVPLTVSALRMDGFDGPIDVTVLDLPPGLQATRGVIRAGQLSTTLTLTADAEAKLTAATPLEIAGAGAGITRMANPEDRMKLIALMPRPDLVMTAETREVTVPQGGTAEITVSIARQAGFHGRVPVEVRNLPPYVRVLDVGLNGVLITEDETRRSFTIEALPGAEPGDQLIYVSGAVETRSGQPSSYAAPEAIKLHVAPR
uniref:Peptidase C-terminal archaeal/bacterial domain-containing protein n=1 Tax=Solibacter usitatus (strain Ellin6076) TaxID=234267 RepID=Q01UL2_SOLUE